jgi:FtsP/CotA-like multicopper oxidase with cupredoxin domain
MSALHDAPMTTERDSVPECEETEELLPSAIVGENLEKGGLKWAQAAPPLSRPPITRLGAFFAVFVTTVVGFVFFFTALIGPCGFLNSTDCLVREQPKPTTFRRPQTDYLLDPRWDFDAAPTTRSYRFTVTDMEVNPDGVYRPMILINGQFPGPLIECNDGDRLVIEVDNQGVNATAFHWHGLFQNGSNWMDGTVGVTQCPIAPGRSFTYDFTISGQHGTYW